MPIRSLHFQLLDGTPLPNKVELQTDATRVGRYSLQLLGFGLKVKCLPNAYMRVRQVKGTALYSVV